MLKLNPGGAKLTTVFVPLVTTALTEQSVLSLSFSFEAPAGTAVFCDVGPHESVTSAGAESSVTAQR